MDILFCIDLYLETNSPVAVKRYWRELWKTAHSSLLADLKQQLISLGVRQHILVLILITARKMTLAQLS